MLFPNFRVYEKILAISAQNAELFVMYIFPMGLIHDPCFYCGNIRYTIKPIKPHNNINIRLSLSVCMQQKIINLFSNHFVWTNCLII